MKVIKNTILIALIFAIVAVFPIKSNAQSKSISKSNIVYLDDGSYIVTGTFTYDGSSSRATGSSASVSILASGWSTTKKNSYYSGNKVTGSCTVSKNGTNIPRTLTITCSKSGTLS